MLRHEVLLDNGSFDSVLFSGEHCLENLELAARLFPKISGDRFWRESGIKTINLGLCRRTYNAENHRRPTFVTPFLTIKALRHLNLPRDVSEG